MCEASNCTHIFFFTHISTIFHYYYFFILTFCERVQGFVNQQKIFSCIKYSFINKFNENKNEKYVFFTEYIDM